MENIIIIRNKKIGNICIAIFKFGQSLIHRCRRSIHHPYVPPVTRYHDLICVTGFGNSGSGTVIDLLSEFDNTTVFGGFDQDSGGPMSRKMYNKSVEVDFLRMSIGVYALENVIESQNVFLKHTMIELFITGAEYYYRSGGFYNDKYMELTRNFIDNLLDYKLISNYCGREYCPDLSFFNYSYGDYKNLSSPMIANFANTHYLYYLKKMTRDEYINIANKYIHDLLCSIESKEYLVLDQIISDGNVNIEHHMRYCGNLKEICIYRDPRDVFASGILTNESWIPRNPKEFVNWYRAKVEDYVSYSHKNYLILRFEDMVLDYSESVKKILEFTGINEYHHISKYSFFNPEISKKNIGIYKKCTDINAIKYIEKELATYCFQEYG